MLEIELTLIPFIDEKIDDSTDYRKIESILQLDDLDLWEIITNLKAVPDNLSSNIIDKLRKFILENKDIR